jgi:hypothetical protein
MKSCFPHKLWLWGLLLSLPTTSCDHQDFNQPRNALPKDGQRKAVMDLGAKIGVSFPTNSVLLDESDGGGRDRSYGFYAWTVFCPETINIPQGEGSGPNGYTRLSLEPAVESISHMPSKQKILRPKSAFSSSWETNGFQFRGTLVHSEAGDYLLIEQFRKN